MKGRQGTVPFLMSGFRRLGLPGFPGLHHLAKIYREVFVSPPLRQFRRCLLKEAVDFRPVSFGIHDDALNVTGPFDKKTHLLAGRRL